MASQHNTKVERDSASTKTDADSLEAIYYLHNLSPFLTRVLLLTLVNRLKFVKSVEFPFKAHFSLRYK